jgi:hypothetical protein
MNRNRTFSAFIWILISTLLIIPILSNSTVSAAAPKDEFPLNLLFSRSDIPRIIENTKNPLFKEYWKSLLDADVNRDHNFLREAFLYAVTGDRNRGEMARKGMLAAVKQEHWDFFVEDGKYSLGFLHTGMQTARLSLSYDWIYDLLTPAERAAIREAIAEKGCVPCYRSLYGMCYPNTVKGWSMARDYPSGTVVPDMSRWPHILGNNNFRAVISGGFALGINVLIGHDDRTDEWLEMLLDSYPRFARLFKADGSYDEAVSYCNYAMTYLIYLMEVVHRKQGIDLYDGANYTGMMDFNLGLLMPQHLDPAGSVNFGDASRSLNSSIGFWVARKSRDGLSQYIAMHYAPNHDIFSLLYYDPSLTPIPPSPDSYFYHADLDWIVTRTGYEMDDLVVAMRSGGPSNHEHADRNSIVLKYQGEMLLVDQYRPTYDYRKPGWFLRTSPAHNTVLIDGKGHQYHNGEEGTNESKASAKIVRSGKRTGYSFWASDATPAYALVNPDVKSVTRTALVFPDIPCLIVMDKLIKEKEGSVFSARWFVENRDKNGACHVNGNTFTLERPEAKLMGVCAGSPQIDLESTALPLPESLGLFPYLDVAAAEKAKEAFIITASVPLKTDENPPDITVKPAEGVWTVNVLKAGKRLNLEIFDRNELPEFEIVEYSYKP